MEARRPGRGPPACSFPPRGAPGPGHLSAGTELDGGPEGGAGDGLRGPPVPLGFHTPGAPIPLSEALSPREPACGQFLSPQTQVRPEAWPKVWLDLVSLVHEKWRAPYHFQVFLGDKL